ncbi:helix-turn-helix domain-containing protein [uncultured Algoriphagus sp.]|uniref:helix-turn-helix transcriptional regulator n=1 Tax=uncultured Algoriphagus sp. TaxID=417365 RepID=UPI0030EDC2AF|tara:strand:+ start:1291 stop:1779 length:489 start_codon:yes stop_codon:yes gene_type:complete
MKTGSENMVFDEVIGNDEELKFTKNDHESIRDYRRKLYENRSDKDKVRDILTGFRFSLVNYVDTNNPDQVKSLGLFITDLLEELNIKKGVFAEYIYISPRNINKYFKGERKFSIDHALMLEKLFNVQAETLLEIQLKNELIETKRSHEGEYDKINLNDLIAG